MKILKRSILLYLGLSEKLSSKRESGFVAYDYLYERLSFYSRSSIREAVNSLGEAELLEKFWRGRRAYFRLTALGKEALERLWPALFGRKMIWHKRFYLVLLKTSKPKDRQLIIRLLNQAGFKKICRGTYLNFYPISEEMRKGLVEKGLLNRLIMAKVKDFGWLTPAEIVFQAWDGKQIQRIAKEFVSEAEELLKNIKTEKRLSKKAKEQFFRLNKKLLLALKRWPRCPSELGGFGSQLERVLQSFKRVNQAWERLKNKAVS